MSERDPRRWTRLKPDALTDSQIGILEAGRARKVELADLSPAGIGFLLPSSPGNRQPYEVGSPIRMRVRFRGHPRVEIPAKVLHVVPRKDGSWRLGLGWIQNPPGWDGIDRREYARLVSPEGGKFSARIPVPFVHGLWTRVTIMDLSSDRGIRIEGNGGPIWLLPGMEVPLHLDLPILHESPLVSQVLWVRPSQGGRVQAGLRILDLEAPALQALDEWVGMEDSWSPRELLSRGFPSPSIPGQYRFRTSDATGEYSAVLDYLSKASRTTEIGFESLPNVQERPEGGLAVVGCWDKDLIVAAIALDTKPEHAEGSVDEVVLAGAAFEIDWFDRVIVRGLWNQVVRLFLASNRPRLRVWCPSGREELYRRIGMKPLPDAELPEVAGPGCWMAITRETILTGSGMDIVTWVWAFGEVGRFHSRQRSLGMPMAVKLQKLLRIAYSAVLSDILLPRQIRKLSREMEAWRLDAAGH